MNEVTGEMIKHGGLAARKPYGDKNILVDSWKCQWNTKRNASGKTFDTRVRRGMHGNIPDYRYYVLRTNL